MKLLSTLIHKVFGGTPETGAGQTTPAPAEDNAPATPPADFDVTSYLDGLAGAAGEKLEWQVSIVDLLKLIGMDSSLPSRKELAQELGYPEDMADSAKMNIWLHKQVMQKIASSGGKLPDSLLA